jgi:hypothetical protein
LNSRPASLTAKKIEKQVDIKLNIPLESVMEITNYYFVTLARMNHLLLTFNFTICNRILRCLISYYKSPLGSFAQKVSFVSKVGELFQTLKYRHPFRRWSIDALI